MTEFNIFIKQYKFKNYLQMHILHSRDYVYVDSQEITDEIVIIYLLLYMYITNLFSTHS